MVASRARFRGLKRPRLSWFKFIYGRPPLFVARLVRQCRMQGRAQSRPGTACTRSRLPPLSPGSCRFATRAGVPNVTAGIGNALPMRDGSVTIGDEASGGAPVGGAPSVVFVRDAMPGCICGAEPDFFATDERRARSLSWLFKCSSVRLSIDPSPVILFRYSPCAPRARRSRAVGFSGNVMPADLARPIASARVPGLV